MAIPKDPKAIFESNPDWLKELFPYQRAVLEGFHHGGTVTGPFRPEYKPTSGAVEFAKRIRACADIETRRTSGEPIITYMTVPRSGESEWVRADFSEIERRVMANLTLKTGIHEAMLGEPASEDQKQRFLETAAQHVAKRVQSSVASLLSNHKLKGATYGKE